LIAGFELTQAAGMYHPLIISINYNEGSSPYAMISYCVFTVDSHKTITGARVVKQVVLINGLPFEIKSIYGMTEESDSVEGKQHIDVKDDDGEKECLICLSEAKDTLIMPCGHFCICSDCGKGLIKAKHTCPVCRGNIGSLIPMKKH